MFNKTLEMPVSVQGYIRKRFLLHAGLEVDVISVRKEEEGAKYNITITFKNIPAVISFQGVESIRLIDKDMWDFVDKIYGAGIKEGLSRRLEGAEKDLEEAKKLMEAFRHFMPKV